MLLILFLSLTVVTALVENAVDPYSQEVKIQGGVLIGRGLNRGRTKRFVQLDGRQKNEIYEACELPDGKPGLCKPPNLCMKKENEGNMIMFADNLCVRSDNKKVGICCAANFDDAIADGVAGDLPAVAAVDEEYSELTRMSSGTKTRGCGVSTRAQGRVTGSGPANPREWPWMVSVTTTYSEPHCGGSLITDSHVMTAGHCVYEIDKEDLKVRLGEYDFKRQNDTRSYNFEVAEVRLHEEFDFYTLRNDIALLKLHRPATFNTYVWPICLPPLGLNLVNETAYLIGWGTKSIGGPHSNVLLEVAIPIWDLEECAESVNEATDENICAGAYEGGKDACQHDSGGPLMYQMNSGRWVVIGIVSWGVRCGEAEHPGLYTKVEAYLPWIVTNTQF